MPPSVIALLETRIDSYGEVIRIVCARVLEGQRVVVHNETRTMLRVGGRTFFDPRVYGRRRDQPSKIGLPIHGIALDEQFAWAEEPYRFLDPLERTEHKVPQGSIGLLTGDDLVVVPIDGDFDALRAFLEALEGFAGPFLIDPTFDPDRDRPRDMAWTTGVKRILWVPVDFDEAPGSRFTESADTAHSVSRARESLTAFSRGRASMEVTYFPGVLRLGPGSHASANARVAEGAYPHTIVPDVITALDAYDRDHGATGAWRAASWDRLAIVVSDALVAPGGSTAVGAFTDSSLYMVFYGLPARFTLHHELGHVFSSGHPYYSEPVTPSNPTGPTRQAIDMPWEQTGEAIDVMRAHPAGLYKFRAYWVDEEEWIDATIGGRYRIVSHDTGPDGLPRLIRVRTVGDERVYWIEMRRLWPDFPRLNEGVQVYWNEQPLTTFLYYAGPPGVTLARQSPLGVGDEITDAGRGLRIRVEAVGTEAGAAYADVAVERF